MTLWRKKRQRAGLAKAQAKARRLKAAAGFRAAYERALFDKGRDPASPPADFLRPTKLR